MAEGRFLQVTVSFAHFASATLALAVAIQKQRPHESHLARSLELLVKALRGHVGALPAPESFDAITTQTHSILAIARESSRDAELDGLIASVEVHGAGFLDACALERGR